SSDRTLSGSHMRPARTRKLIATGLRSLSYRDEFLPGGRSTGSKRGKEARMTHKVGTREEWLVARTALLADEKDLTRRSDLLARKRQALPWVPVGKDYSFEAEDGR